MESHMSTVHTVHGYLAPQYACIYCKFNMKNKMEVEKHLALCHLDELDFVCERKLKQATTVSFAYR